jgi:hypothetical protein
MAAKVVAYHGVADAYRAMVRLSADENARVRAVAVRAVQTLPAGSGV